jgi:hypothetical protein
MSIKAPKDYTIDEVCIWLNAIGLGSKAASFEENSVDGTMLVSLTSEDLQGDLGLSSLQARKFQQKLDFSKGLSGDGGFGSADQSDKIAALEAENARLRGEVADLKAVINALQEPAPARAPAPAPAPPVSKPPPQQRAGRPVVRGAAGGAAKGAMLGAIGGAIAGDAGKGAKMGAAMGAAGGGMGGLAARRRQRRGFH